MSAESIRVYLCYEPDQRLCADPLNSWPVTNADLDAYDRRVQTPVDSAEAKPIKEALTRQIKAADVTICIVGPETHASEWIAWELEASKSGPKRNGLVGIVLHEYDKHPPAMVDSGGIFVRFKRDLVERGVRWAVEEPRTSDDFTLVDE
jgi:antiphage defense system Thoeris ThsB-like protein